MAVKHRCELRGNYIKNAGFDKKFREKYALGLDVREIGLVKAG
ncbi:MULTISPECIES: hypothetical protein [unclassified Helicobacter]|nr:MULTISPECIES: hypothetical protein [unclassified Helicobacter]